MYIAYFTFLISWHYKQKEYSVHINTLSNCKSVHSPQSNKSPEREIWMLFECMMKLVLDSRWTCFTRPGSHCPQWGLIPFRGPSCEFAVMRGRRKADERMNVETSPTTSPLSLCASLGISHQIRQILMTPVKMNITCHQIPCCMI